MNDTDHVFIKSNTLFLETSDYGEWKLPIGEIKLIGEYTNEEGPFLEDHFLVLITSSGELFEVSVGVKGFNAMLEHLESTLGCEIVLCLHLNTTFKSRVVFPSSMQGVDLFIITENQTGQSNFFTKIMHLFKMPSYAMELSQEVKEYLESVNT